MPSRQSHLSRHPPPLPPPPPLSCLFKSVSTRLVTVNIRAMIVREDDRSKSVPCTFLLLGLEHSDRSKSFDSIPNLTLSSKVYQLNTSKVLSQVEQKGHGAPGPAAWRWELPLVRQPGGELKQTGAAAVINLWGL